MINNQIYDIDSNDIRIKKEKFENEINLKIDNDLFKNFYLNAKFFPNLNSISRNYLYTKPLYLKTKVRIPKAFASLYSDLSSKKINTDIKIENIIKKINNDGYYIIKNFISLEEIENLKSDLCNQTFSSLGSNNLYNYKDLLEYEKIKKKDNYF